MTKTKDQKMKDARTEKCFKCGEKADEFLFIIFKPSLSGKPFCKNCIKKIQKECGL